MDIIVLHFRAGNYFTVYVKKLKEITTLKANLGLQLQIMHNIRGQVNVHKLPKIKNITK